MKDSHGIILFFGITVILIILGALMSRYDHNKEIEKIKLEHAHWWARGFSEGQQFSLRQAHGGYTNVHEAGTAAETRFKEVQQEVLK